MNSKQEYEQFLAKFLKTIRNLKSDFNDLSPETQQRFMEIANAILRGYGYTIPVEDLIAKYFR